MTLKWPKFLTFKRTLMLLLLLVLLIVASVYMFGGYKAVTPVYDAEPFSEEGFKKHKDFKAGDLENQVFTSDNGDFTFIFDPTTTTFQLLDNVTGMVWKSNPDFGEPDTFPKIIDSTRNYQKSTLVINYVTLKGATASFTTYERSVYENSDEGIEPTYSVRYDHENNTVSVLYEVSKKGIDYTYLPYKISPERMDEIIAKNKELVDSGAEGVKELTALDKKYLTTVYYKLDNVTDPANPFYELQTRSGNYESVSGIFRRAIHDILYNNCGYTRDDVVYDNGMFDIVIDMDQPEFTVGVVYKLTDEGLKVTIPANSIREKGSFQIATIDILPYLTAAKRGTEGYMVIPDGSGAVMNFDNDKLAYGAYSKRVYGEDASYFEELKPTTVEDILLPMYGFINKSANTGVMVTADKGAGQLNLAADISNRIDSYNKIEFQAYLREPQMITVGTGYNAIKHIQWTPERIMNDIELNYQFLDSGEADYSAMAQKYRDYLGLEQKDTTTESVLNLEIIGSYDYKTDFMGIGYTAYDSLTTYDEAMTIIDQMLGQGYKDINVLYRGWQDDGLKNPSISEIELSRKLGGSKALNRFIAYTKDKNISFYPYVSFSEFNEFNESFGKQHYSSRTIGNEFSYRYPYDPSSGIFDQLKDRIMIASPKYYTTFMTKFADEFNRKVGINSVAFDLLGSSLGGDYKKHSIFYREAALREQLASFEKAQAKGISDINLFTPYAFAFPYTANAVQVPYSSTAYEILDYPIPFYQLVVSGAFDYSGITYNANDEKGMMWHLMHMIETGSNADFTVTFDESEKLLLTKYNSYYYTQYEKWLGEVKEIADTLNGLGIFSGRLVRHERLQSNVYQVTYSNGVEIILNYTENAVDVGGLTVQPNSYLKK